MKSISALAIVSIIAILLAIGLVYMVVKPPSFLKITTTSYIPTTETITETLISYIPTTYYITTTYILISTYQTPPTTITQTITYTYVPAEKLEILADFEEHTWGSGEKSLTLSFVIMNKEYSSIYIDPNRTVRIEGEGILINHPNPYWSIWDLDLEIKKQPFIFSGSPYNPHVAGFSGELTCRKYFPEDPDYYDPEKIKFGQNYTVSFDYRVIYLNGTWSDWKTYTFNVTLQKSSD